MPVLTKTEITRARVGPRELKDPRSKAYAIQTLSALKRYAESLRCDQELVAKELATIDRYRHWELLGYASKDDLLTAELTLQGQQNVAAVVAKARADDEHGELAVKGEIGNGRRSYKITPKQRGTDPTYLARRLHRDAPEVFAALERGEHRSVRAAAIVAGLIRLKTPVEQLEHWWAKASSADRRAFLRAHQEDL